VMAAAMARVVNIGLVVMITICVVVNVVVYLGGSSDKRALLKSVIVDHICSIR
jgi:hypothetical protein